MAHSTTSRLWLSFFSPRPSLHLLCHRISFHVGLIFHEPCQGECLLRNYKKNRGVYLCGFSCSVPSYLEWCLWLPLRSVTTTTSSVASRPPTPRDSKLRLWVLAVTLTKLLGFLFCELYFWSVWCGSEFLLSFPWSKGPCIPKAQSSSTTTPASCCATFHLCCWYYSRVSFF